MEPIDRKTATALEHIITERQRQDILKAEGRFKHTCADPELSMMDCMMILVEEVGELSRAILTQERLTFDRPDHLGTDKDLATKTKEEVVQVAAVALAIAERFVPDSSSNP
jgi:NTP pyrophosphatase (non-canonical NTP hydrolase)